MSAKYQKGQEVRCVNEKRFWKVESVTFDGSQYFYNIVDRHNNIVNRIAEIVLIAKDEK